MRSPSDMTIIQIELTNACPHRCSNCTRLCGHHKKPFFMDWATFKKAVKSLEGFQGMAGLMGGEPTLHPRFEDFALYLAEHFGVRETLPRGRLPIADFSEYISETLLKDSRKRQGRCLCSSTGSTYYKHFEIIQESFHYQLLNDHQHSGLHQGILVSRKDMGIPDEEWFPIRDACWLQNNWSASITPKGAFFCEVAATLDMLFDGPGGWPIEPGWWKRKPEEFGEQLNWCEMCGISFNGPKTLAKDEMDDISPGVLERMKSLDSPKIKAGKYKVCTALETAATKVQYTPGKPFYLPDGDSNRRLAGTSPMRPGSIHGIVFSHDHVDINTYRNLAAQLDSLLIHTPSLLSPETKQLFSLSGIHLSEGQFNLGDVLSEMKLKDNDWITIISPGISLSKSWRDRIKRIVFNPGCLYAYGHENKTRMLSEELATPCFFHQNGMPAFAFCMFNLRARTWRNMERIPLSIEDLFRLWPEDKIIPFDNGFDSPAAIQKQQTFSEDLRSSLMSQHLLSCWQMISQLNNKVALYGAGQHTKWMLNHLAARGLKMPRVIFDDNPRLKNIMGIPVEHPIKRYPVKIIFISSDSNAAEMTEKARRLWSSGETIINPYCGFKNPLFKKT